MSLDPWTLVTIIFAIYVFGVAVFVIMENRSPQSTFAWLFLFMALPLLGVLIYIFLGVVPIHLVRKEPSLAPN
ncbi:MAG: hypothetical protein HC804_11085 [Anaerolineae bacterium]|nr:hypothetical protein [Anaerolineae bacterium]